MPHSILEQNVSLCRNSLLYFNIRIYESKTLEYSVSTSILIFILTTNMNFIKIIYVSSDDNCQNSLLEDQPNLK